MNISKYNRLEGTYILNTGEITVGANKLMFDLFNASPSNKNILVFGLFAVAKGDVAVTGVVSARFDVYRTNAVGTGGTSVTYGSTAKNIINIAPMDTQNPTLPTQINARQAPTGGCTIEDWLFQHYSFTEETNAGIYQQQNTNILNSLGDVEPLVLRQGQGLMVQQDTVASVNSFVFRVIFGIVGA